MTHGVLLGDDAEAELKPRRRLLGVERVEVLLGDDAEAELKPLDSTP